MEFIRAQPPTDYHPGLVLSRTRLNPSQNRHEYVPMRLFSAKCDLKTEKRTEVLRQAGQPRRPRPAPRTPYPLPKKCTRPIIMKCPQWHRGSEEVLFFQRFPLLASLWGGSSPPAALRWVVLFLLPSEHSQRFFWKILSLQWHTSRRLSILSSFDLSLLSLFSPLVILPPLSSHDAFLDSTMHAFFAP